MSATAEVYACDECGEYTTSQCGSCDEPVCRDCLRTIHDCDDGDPLAFDPRDDFSPGIIDAR